MKIALIVILVPAFLGVAHAAPPAEPQHLRWSPQKCHPALLSESDDHCMELGGWRLHRDSFHTSTNLAVEVGKERLLSLTLGYQVTILDVVEWHPVMTEHNAWAVLVPFRFEDPEDERTKPFTAFLVLKLGQAGACGVGVEPNVDSARTAARTKVPRFACPAKKCDIELGPCPQAKVGRFFQRWPNITNPAPESPAQVLNQRGLAARKAGQHLQAATFYNEALKLDPAHVWARYNLACELALMGERDSAIQQLTSIANLATAEAREALRAAKKDKDFQVLRTDSRFIRLTR